MPFAIDDAIIAAMIGATGSIAGSAIGKNAATGSDLNPRQHRELWTERLRFNQQSRRQRNDLADYEQRRANYRQGLIRRFNRYQSMYDAGTSRNIRRQEFNQTLGMNSESFNQQLGFNQRGFNQQLGFNRRGFQQQQAFTGQNFLQGQYLEGMRLNTETAGRAGQRGIAQRQELEGMFPEASPWDLMGTGHQASSGQAVLPGYPSAQSANNAAGPSPSEQLRASEMASSAKMAAMLLPTPAVQAAQAGAHAQMYSSTVHAMSGLAQALISAQAPKIQAGIAGKKAPSEIDLNKKRGGLASVQAGTEVGKQEIQDYEIPIKKAEARHAGTYYKGRADYESQRTNLGYGQLGVSGLGVLQANKLLNRLGRTLSGQSDQLTKKLSGARSIKSSASKFQRDNSTPRYWRDDAAIPRSLGTGLSLW
ncbi:hypothetical protein [Thiolapillus sp.]|uniref:hypothetical protein n=1 Tax=Thiolapillus sp. TaxID=2017437 RepID=UPI003AF4AC9A